MNNKLTTIYIVRHGETEWNLKEIMQGHVDSPLTAKGHEQAMSLAIKLREIKFDAIFSSDLARAQKTAEYIAIEKKLAIITTRALRERCYGKYDGRPRHYFFDDFRRYLKKRGELSEEERFKFKLHKSVESDFEGASRFIISLREIAVGYPGKTVLVVTHGGIMRCFLIKLGYVSYKEIPVGAMFISNGAYIKIESDGVDFFIKETIGITKAKT